MEEEKAEAARPKSENYNEKIDRDVKIEQAKEDLKKERKGLNGKAPLPIKQSVQPLNPGR